MNNEPIKERGVYMYRGQKDAHISIRVPMELCYLIENDSGEWIEIMVPPLDFMTSPDKPWESFLVRPNQIFWFDAYNNKIEGMLQGTAIKCCQHFTDEIGRRRIVSGTEHSLDPYEIIRNIENYNYWQNKPR